MIIKAALILTRDNNNGVELLFVRPKDKPHFVFPGGKQEAGETIEVALHRESLEELGTHAPNAEKIGVVSGHTPDGRELEMHLFVGQLIASPQPLAEIAELAWMSREEALARANELTPMALDHVFPYLANRGIW